MQTKVTCTLQSLRWKLSTRSVLSTAVCETATGTTQVIGGVDPEELARQLCLMDHAVFMRVTARELTVWGWTRRRPRLTRRTSTG